MKRILIELAAVALIGALGAMSATASTLEEVKARGHVNCGTSAGYLGFSNADKDGVWRGFSVDICRAIAAAVGVNNAKFSVLGGAERFNALATGAVDILVMNNTQTMTRDTTLGVTFSPVHYYDVTGFIIHKSAGAKKIADLDGAQVCLPAGSTAAGILVDVGKKRGIDLSAVVTFKSGLESKNGFLAGRCDYIVCDRTNCANIRATAKDPSAIVVLDEGIGDEWLANTTASDDNQWNNIVKWVFYALVGAEEFGVTQANVDEMIANAKDLQLRALLGVDKNLGEGLGLDDQWAVRAIKAVGNYGEIFERNIGANTVLGLSRGRNALLRDGGLHHSPSWK